MGNGTILSELDHDAGAPARFIDSELHARIEAMHKAPQVAPGLLAWIDSASQRPLTGAHPDRPVVAAGSTGRRKSLLNYLIRAQQQRLRNRQAERLGRLETYHEFQFRWLQNR